MKKYIVSFITFLILLITVIFIIVRIVQAYSKGHTEYNCSDFKTQLQAQQLFEQNEKDVYGLDRDHDGLACEHLPK
jgi:uncharacterized membrane protein